MKKRTKMLAMVLCIAQSLLFCACLDDDSPLASQSEKNLIEEIKIDTPDENAVTVDDAATVALKQLGRDMLKGRSASNYSISTVDDETGEPALYIVNFDNNGGFVVVSAKREINPVLAWNTKGQYAVTENSGVKIWQDHMVKAIQNADNQEDSVKHINQRIWASMTNENVPEAIAPMSANSSDEWTVAQKILREKLLEWKNDGVDVYPLKYWYSQLQHYGLEKTYRNFDWEECAYVTERDSNIYHNNTFIKTKWGQEAGFNAYCKEINGKKAVAGCVPVACGQLMYYYRFPAKYDWDNMALNYATDASALLIADLGKGMKAEYGLDNTGVEPGDCINYMKKLGYNCHEEKSLSASVRNKMEKYMHDQKPILLRLENNGKHRIVVGGMSISQINVIDDIWTFTTATKYEIAASERVYSARHVYFYLNWGWYGVNDGFYHLDHITFNNSDKTETWKASDAIFVEPNN